MGRGQGAEEQGSRGQGSRGENYPMTNDQ